jgi:GTP-binding protein
MSLPLVVIVGRPNVGKSSLLNALAGQRISIVDPRSGITRDRVSTIVEHQGHYFELMDTGGVGIVDDDHLEAQIEEQIRFALDRADAVLLVVDITAGLTPLDQTVAELLRRTEKPVLVAVNKVDHARHEPQAGQFLRLGHGDPLCVSALHGGGRQELLDCLIGRLGPGPPADLPAPVMKLAIIGRRNVGKSTLVNALAGEPRMIVSEIPGTTRDAVDVRFERDGRQFIAIDTAGVRKKSSMSDIDFYSYTRALRSIRRADVVMLMIDALVPVAEVDLQLARAALDEFKPVVITVNKWDLARDRARPGEFNEYLTRVLPALSYAPIVFVTATTGHNVDAAVQVALSLHRQAHTRIPTGRLNSALREILAQRGPSPKRGTKPVRVYYATQIAVAPPTIVFFCNDPALVREDYRRFMQNRLRELTPFKEVPLRLWFRPRGEGRGRSGRACGDRADRDNGGTRATRDSDDD